MVSASANNQHYVPQLLLKRFALGQNNLYVMNKPSLDITGPRSIRRLAAEQGYYGPTGCSYDQMLQQIETAFGRVLKRIDLVQSPSDLGGRDVTEITWFVASQLARTDWFGELGAFAIAPQAVKVSQFGKASQANARAFHTRVLVGLFQHPDWQWLLTKDEESDEGGLFLPDTGAAWVFDSKVQQPLIACPISPRTLLLGGSGDALRSLDPNSGSRILIHLLASARECVYSGSREVLSRIVQAIRDRDDVESTQNESVDRLHWYLKPFGGAVAPVAPDVGRSNNVEVERERKVHMLAKAFGIGS